MNRRVLLSRSKGPIVLTSSGFRPIFRLDPELLHEKICDDDTVAAVHSKVRTARHDPYCGGIKLLVSDRVSTCRLLIG